MDNSADKTKSVLGRIRYHFGMKKAKFLKRTADFLMDCFRKLNKDTKEIDELIERDPVFAENLRTLKKERVIYLPSNPKRLKLIKELIYPTNRYFDNPSGCNKETGWTNYNGDREFYDCVKVLLDGEIDQLLKGVFDCPYRVLYSTLFRTDYVEGFSPESHFIWHSDGRSVNNHFAVFIYLNEVSKDNGAFQYHPITSSSEIFKRGFDGDAYGRQFVNKECAALLEDEQRYKVVEGPAGTAFITSVTSLIHKAGFPNDKGKFRELLVFQVAPGRKSESKFVERAFKGFGIYRYPLKTLRYWLLK